MMPEGLLRWLRELPLPARLGLYAASVVSAFVLAVAVGGLAAVAVGGDLVLSGRDAPRPLGGGAQDTTLQNTASRDKSVRAPRYTTPEGKGRAGTRGASTGTPLWEELEGCERAQQDCAREFVARVAPQAEYVGGRIDTDDSGETHHVLFFVDPARAPCEYEEFESPADASGVSYDVLIAGEGSFARRQQEGGGRGCLPKL
jgi:hypothetical protein